MKEGLQHKIQNNIIELPNNNNCLKYNTQERRHTMSPSTMPPPSNPSSPKKLTSPCGLSPTPILPPADFSQRDAVGDKLSMNVMSKTLWWQRRCGPSRQGSIGGDVCLGSVGDSGLWLARRMERGSCAMVSGVRHE